MAKSLQATNLEISQVKAMVSQLEETKRQMSDSLVSCKAAIESNDPTLVSDYALNLEPELRDAQKLLEDKAKTPPTEPETKSNGFTTRFDTDFSNGFSNSDTGFGKFDDGFGASAFGSGGATKAADPFAPAAVDPFAPKAGTTTSEVSFFLLLLLFVLKRLNLC